MERSMNGLALPFDSREMRALSSYMRRLSTGIPDGAMLVGAAFHSRRAPRPRGSPTRLSPGWALDRAPQTSIYHPYRCLLDGKIVTKNVHELRPKPADTEKITINLGYVDLGHVDLMVQEGFYSNRTDFIRTAIRNQLERHADVVKQSTARKSLDLGLRNYSREDLEAARRAGEMLHINVLGLASIAQDVTPELARATIASVSVLGALHASPAVKAALADRTR
jgi:Arc/MetJ-type ribon-helix-helix transcriptional regulator